MIIRTAHAAKTIVLNASTITSKMILTLPYPPSVNTYWGFHGHRRFLTKKALEFKSKVEQEISVFPERFGDSRISIMITLSPPDKRIRDIDNVLKPLLDALVAGGLFSDDSNVDVLLVIRSEVIKGGRCTVEIGAIT